MTGDLNEPVFQQEVDTELEYAIEGWKNFYSFFRRLEAQQAPPELLSKVSEITNVYKTLTERIEAIQPFFPVEKRR